MKEAEKKENFDRISGKRLQKTLRDLALIGNLSNQSRYSYSEEKIDEMFSLLEADRGNKIWP